MSLPYMIQLMFRLSGGVELTKNAWKDRQTKFIRTFLTEQGGFAGRQGQSDLYYTSFGLRALALLGRLDNSTAQKTSSFLQHLLLNYLYRTNDKNKSSFELSSADSDSSCLDSSSGSGAAIFKSSVSKFFSLDSSLNPPSISNTDLSNADLSNVDLSDVNHSNIKFSASDYFWEPTAIHWISFCFSALLLEFVCGCSLFSESDWSTLNLDKKTFFWRQLATFKRADGGFASSCKTPYSSTYHSFLTAIVQETLDIPITADEINRLQQFCLNRQRADGGFVELEKLRESGTNPTAAAAGLLRLLDIHRSDLQYNIPSDQQLNNSPDSQTILKNPPTAFQTAADFVPIINTNLQKKTTEKIALPVKDARIDSIDKEKAVNFLLSQEMPDGGFRANSKIPAADLLSTFTAIVALLDLSDGKTPDCLNTQRHLAYVDSLECQDGGYRGNIWDNEPDVEYTFYGLALRSLLLSLESEK